MFATLSLECMPVDLRAIGDWLPLLDGTERVFVPHIRGREPGEQAAAIARLRAEGLNPVPHLAARNVKGGDAELKAHVGRLVDAGAREVLLLGGGENPPLGGFDSALRLMRSDALRDSGIRAVGMAGHPEGHPDVPDGTMFQALLDKSEHAREAGWDAFIVTQLCFEPRAVGKWLARVRDAGVDWPVHFGIAGPISLPRLIRLSGTLGVGKSLGFLKSGSRNLLRMVNPTYDPAETLDGVERACGAMAGSITPHFYTFGNVAGSIRVLRPGPAATRRAGAC